MTGMRAAPLVLAGFIALAAVAGWSLYEGGDAAPPPPPGAEQPGPHEREAAELASGERSPVAAAEPTDPATQTGAAPTGAAPADASPTDAAATLRLHVRSQATFTEVADFRWRFRTSDSVQHGEGRGGMADVRLRHGIVGELLVEADGFMPHVCAAAATTIDMPAVVDVFLAPAVRAAGITLMVHDTALQPAPHVRVDAFVLTSDNRDGAWHLGTPLWARRTDAEDGRYVLPDLPPGEYGIRVLATDAEGTTLPLLPFLRRYWLRGDNGFIEDVALEPGCLPILIFVDGANKPLDPAKTKVTALRLHAPGGPPVPRVWTAATEKGAKTAVDLPPAVGPTWPAQPLAPGTYTLELFVADQLRVQQLLTLRAGERQEERIVVP